jgi:hypothetical protein
MKKNYNLQSVDKFVCSKGVMAQNQGLKARMQSNASIW